MKRARTVTFAILAIAGTTALVLTAIAVVGDARTSFDLAVLGFTAVAAIVGWLGLLISWLTYLLEAGKVPKPDLGFLQDGKSVKRLRTELEVQQADTDFTNEIQTERERLLALVKPPTRSLTEQAYGGLWRYRSIAGRD